MSTSTSKGEDTRQRIIAAAAPLFNQQGYAGCALKDIMQATGLEKGGIYRHFESKEELAAEAFDYAWAVSMALHWQGIEDIPNHIDRLKRHIASFAHRSSIPGGCPLLNTGVDSDNGNPVLREHVQKALRGWQKKLRTILIDGMEAGTIRSAIDVDKVSRLIVSGLEGGILVSRIERNDQARQDAMEFLNTFLELQVRAPRVRATKPSARAKKTH